MKIKKDGEILFVQDFSTIGTLFRQASTKQVEITTNSGGVVKYERLPDCELCVEAMDGEKAGGDAEMYDPQDVYNEGEPILCHAECGIAKGLEVA